jgi:18S rRNA (guanine1575-N7)-methyltransferase
MMEIQWTMTERALELLSLPEDTSCSLLDLGCGSGLSGAVLEEQGHVWTGVDIAPAMLGQYKVTKYYSLLSHFCTYKLDLQC